MLLHPVGCLLAKYEGKKSMLWRQWWKVAVHGTIKKVPQ
jgi:hypothetical protein